MELATLARPYAIAAFKAAKEADKLTSWSKMLSVLSAATGHERVSLLLESPEFPADVKAHRLSEVCGDELDGPGRLFLQALAEHNRLPLLPEILVQFELLKAKEEESLDVEVVSAMELTESQSEEIKNSLKARFDKEISIEAKVDESLIGGAIIRAGDLVIDGSARGKLTKLAEALTRN